MTTTSQKLLTCLLPISFCAQIALASNPLSDLYDSAAEVQIRGYQGEAMEPCISLDGQYLFFNNSNDIPDTHVYFARKKTDKCFDFIGEVPGLRGKTREMAPSIDASGAFYFTTQRSYDHDRRSIYAGKWEGAKLGVTSIAAAEGDISPEKLFWINMDCGVSADGGELYLSRARFNLWGGPPAESDILMAVKTPGNPTGKFRLVDASKSKLTTLQTINTKDLEYAPAISADGLEFYFTRANMSNSPPTQIMVATRKSKTEIFGQPQKLSAVEGFSEAPSLSADKSRLHFHKKVAGHYVIFVCRRR